MWFFFSIKDPAWIASHLDDRLKDFVILCDLFHIGTCNWKKNASSCVLCRKNSTTPVGNLYVDDPTVYVVTHYHQQRRMTTYKEMLSRSNLQQHQHNFTYTQSSHVNGSNAIVEEKVKFLSEKDERMNIPNGPLRYGYLLFNVRMVS